MSLKKWSYLILLFVVPLFGYQSILVADSSADNELIELMQEQFEKEDQNSKEGLSPRAVTERKKSAYRAPRTKVAMSSDQEKEQSDYIEKIDKARSEIEGDSYVGKRLGKDRHYGSSRLRLGVARPDFNESSADLIETYYNDEAWYPTVGYDLVPISGWFGLGVSLRLGYYSDKGSAIRTNAAGESVVDSSTEARLMLFPMQGLLMGSYNPFHKKWLGVDVWGGYEYLYKRETLDSGDDVNTALNSSSSKHLYVVGGSVNFILNWIEPSSVNSMRASLGYGSLYLSGYYEISKTFKSEGYELGRTTMGLQFVFEKAI